MRVKVFVAIMLFAFLVVAIAQAMEYSATGFYWPLKDDSPNFTGRWLARYPEYLFTDASGNKLYHIGVDMAANQGTSVYAIADGVLVDISDNGWSSGSTTNVALLIRHKLSDGRSFIALYGHLKQDGAAQLNQTIKAGQKIGELGDWNNTGDHIHFGILTPGLSGPPQSGYGRWPDSKYGIKDGNYYDNGFVDPVWFITHAMPDNWISRGLIEPNNPLTVDNPWFVELCEKSYDSRCSPDAISNITECVYERSTLCAPPISEYSAVENGGYTSGGSGGDVGIPTPTPEPQNPPDLKVREITVYDANGLLLTERDSVLVPGEVLDGRVNIISLEENCQNGMMPGKDTVETDIYYKIALGDDSGSYVFLTRVYTEAWRLTEDNHHIEHFSYTVPAEAAGKRVYFRAEVDSTSEVTESDENNNWSGTDEWYAVEGNCDIAITNVALTNNRTTLNEGERFGIGAWVKNQGTTTCPFSTRLAYYHQNPGQTTWTEMATDGTDVAELIPGVEKYEYTTGEPFIANIPGIHRLMACGDYLKDQPETNENNNCMVSEFTVNSYKPDIVTTQVGLTNGRTELNLNDKFGLTLSLKNIGNAPATTGIRSGYYVKRPGDVNWQYWADDGTDVAELCVGCQMTEYTTGEPFTANQIGTWQVLAWADYQNALVETDEANNQKIATFTVNPVGPNLISSDVYIKVNGTTYRDGATIRKDSRIQIYCKITNIGNFSTHPAFRAAYNIDGQYRDSDGVDANQVCVGCTVTEYISSESSIKLGNTGWRTIECHVDYQAKVAETDETDNRRSIRIYVK